MQVTELFAWIFILFLSFCTAISTLVDFIKKRPVNIVPRAFALLFYITASVLGIIATILRLAKGSNKEASGRSAYYDWKVAAQISADVAIQAVALFDCIRESEIIGKITSNVWRYGAYVAAGVGVTLTGASARWNRPMIYARFAFAFFHAMPSVYYFIRFYQFCKSTKPGRVSIFGWVNVIVLSAVIPVLLAPPFTSFILFKCGYPYFSDTLYHATLSCLLALALANVRWIPGLTTFIIYYFRPGLKPKKLVSDLEAQAYLSTTTLVPPQDTYRPMGPVNEELAILGGSELHDRSKNGTFTYNGVKGDTVLRPARARVRQKADAAVLTLDAQPSAFRNDAPGIFAGSSERLV